MLWDKKRGQKWYESKNVGQKCCEVETRVKNVMSQKMWVKNIMR